MRMDAHTTKAETGIGGAIGCAGMGKQSTRLGRGKMIIPRMSAFERRQIRLQVFLRDEGKCFWCDKALTFKESTFDHIIPKSRGGGYSYDNGVLSCKRCNLLRGDIGASDYLCKIVYGT